MRKRGLCRLIYIFYFRATYFRVFRWQLEIKKVIHHEIISSTCIAELYHSLNRSSYMKTRNQFAKANMVSNIWIIQIVLFGLIVVTPSGLFKDVQGQLEEENQSDEGKPPISGQNNKRFEPTIQRWRICDNMTGHINLSVTVIPYSSRQRLLYIKRIAIIKQF